jgi:hypothetical protein
MVQEHHAAVEPELGAHIERKRGWGLLEGHAWGTIPAGNGLKALFTGRILFG